MAPAKAALIGTREVTFTVIAMSVSLVAVFIPVLLMGGYVGRLFREFAATLTAAIMISLVVSLATTPMLCAHFLRDHVQHGQSWWSRVGERGFGHVVRGYAWTLDWSLRHSFMVLLTLLIVLGLNVYLFVIVPKGFFPQQDTGRIAGGIRADQSISFQAMRQKLAQFVDIIGQDPAVASVAGFTGGGATNGGFVFISLKPLAERQVSADQVIARLRRPLASVPGAMLFLQATQDIRIGGRQSNAQYQYTLRADNLEDLRTWTPRVAEALRQVPELVDVDSDQQEKGLQMDLKVDRDMAARLGITMSQIDNTLYDAFGQRQVSTIYTPLNQYHVVMEVAPEYWQNPETLKDIYISTRGTVSGSQATNAVAGTTTTVDPRTGRAASANASSIASDAARNLAANRLGTAGRSASTGTAVSTSPAPMVPLSAVATFAPGTAPLAVNHQGPFVASTIAFNLPPDGTLGDAVRAIEQTMNRVGVPASVHGTFQGTAQAFQQSLRSQPVLILAAIIAVYLVLGILYESYVHPITILSTLPSAGIGAVLALLLFNIEFSIIALIGIILLIGIVKKNAIMMIDFALDAERTRGLAPEAAIREACLLRFRPILMTTLAAVLGAVPLAIGVGDGAELRRPLGISIIGGLAVSQILTLYTTPVVYLYLDRLRLWRLRRVAGQHT